MMLISLSCVDESGRARASRFDCARVDRTSACLAGIRNGGADGFSAAALRAPHGFWPLASLASGGFQAIFRYVSGV
jgi:hypothetical protein